VIALGRLHQLTVDTYAAQHPGSQVPAISTPFALIGLLLTLEEGWSGLAVRAAHGWLAAHHAVWPRFTPPLAFGALTAARVADARTPEVHARLVEAWSAATWAAWAQQHTAVRDWAREVLAPDTRGRLLADTGGSPQERRQRT